MFKPETDDFDFSPNHIKRKASLSSITESPNKMARIAKQEAIGKVAKQEPAVKTEAMEVDQDTNGAAVSPIPAVASSSKVGTALFKKEPLSDLAKSPLR